MKLTTMIKPALLTLAVATVVAACNDGHQTASTPPVTPAVTSEVPGSASTTVADFISYLKALISSAADTLEPVDVSKVTPKQDDVSEPMAVN